MLFGKINDDMLTKEEIRSLREQLRMDYPAFAKMLGVDVRSVTRWESGSSKPSGAAEALLIGLKEKLNKDPSQADSVIGFIAGAVAVGGLAYLLIKLLDTLTKENDG